MLSNLTALAMHRVVLRVHHAHLDLLQRPDSIARRDAYERALRDAHGLIEQLAPDARTHAEDNLRAATRLGEATPATPRRGKATA